MRDFRVQSATRGKDAQGESVVEVEYGDHLYRGRGVSTDTVEASIRAFINAVNRVEAGIGQPITEASRVGVDQAPTAKEQRTQRSVDRSNGPTGRVAVIGQTLWT